MTGKRTSDPMTSKGVSLLESEWTWIKEQADRMGGGLTPHAVTQNLVRIGISEIKAGRKFHTETIKKLADPK